MAGRLVALDLHHAEALETFLVDFDADPSELHAYFCDRNATIETAARELQDWADGAGLKAAGRRPQSGTRSEKADAAPKAWPEDSSIYIYTIYMYEVPFGPRWCGPGRPKMCKKTCIFTHMSVFRAPEQRVLRWFP